MGASAVLGMREPKRASVLAAVPFNLKVNGVGMISGFMSFEPYLASSNCQIHQIRIRILTAVPTHTPRNRCHTTVKPSSSPLRFLRSIGCHCDGRLGTEEASAHTDHKDGSLPFGVSSSS